MKKELTQTLVVAKLALLMLWPVSAWAATLTFGGQMAQIPLLDLAMTLILSILSGVTALVHAMKQEYEKSGAIPRLGLFVASKLLGSIVAGLLMFFGADSWDIPSTRLAAAIILCSFGGTWLIERALNFFVTKHLPEPRP